MGKYEVVDLFAGPGGLAEGFTRYRDSRGMSPFRVAFSVEKEQSAYRTLRLRSFLRQFGNRFPGAYYDFLKMELPIEEELRFAYSYEWEQAENEALNLELGTEEARRILRPRIQGLDGRRTIIIGGPPCQAYSLAGRSRNRGSRHYVPEKDDRHFLYQEYIKILRRVAPAAFVMENVKGLLSSNVNGGLIGEKILSDLQSTCGVYGGYRLFPLESRHARLIETPKLSDFVVRTEKHGIPQARHRLIIVGIRADLCEELDLSGILSLETTKQAPAELVLSSLPSLRSGLSKGEDNWENWSVEVLKQMQRVADATERKDKAVSTEARRFIRRHRGRNTRLRRYGKSGSRLSCRASEDLRDWIVDPRLDHVPNHETRSHISSDLSRYFFACVFAQVHGVSPMSEDFPGRLAPDHASWRSGKFADRFRVQLGDRPSTTVTSHISKDGHYFIHPDPMQCRSLTVREAARLQTFPDNYLFLGNRTEQYVQVGNAVPPFLARQIAGALHRALRVIDRYYT